MSRSDLGRARPARSGRLQLPPPRMPMDPALAEKAARTDVRLHEWRSVAEGRRTQWQQARAVAEAEQKVRRRRLYAATGLSLAAVAAGAAVVVWFLLGSGRAGAAQSEPVVAAVVAEAPAAPPVAVALPIEPIAQDPVPEGPSSPFLAGTARSWQEGGMWWAAFESRESGLLQFRYRDGAGQPALDPKGCPRATDEAGVRRCEAGRSLDRIRAEIAQGAAPGRWSVSACAGERCEPLGVLEVE